MKHYTLILASLLFLVLFAQSWVCDFQKVEEAYNKGHVMIEVKL